MLERPLEFNGLTMQLTRLRDYGFDYGKSPDPGDPPDPASSGLLSIDPAPERPSSSWSGTPANQTDWWVEVIHIDGLWDSDILDERFPIPAMDGERSGDDFYGGKSLTLNGIVHGRTLAGLRAGQRAVQAAFADIDIHPLYMRSWADTNRLYLNCRKIQPLDMPEEITNATKPWDRPFTVGVRADDPRIYSTLEQTEDVLGGTAGGGTTSLHLRDYPYATLGTVGGTAPDTGLNAAPQGLFRPGGNAIQTAYVTDMSGVTIYTHWQDLQTADANALSATEVAAINIGISWARSHGKKARIRVFCGQWSPGWVMTAAGRFKANDPQSSSAPQDIPKFWTAAYLAKYDRLIALMAAQWNNETVLTDITVSGVMTIFAEPMQRGITGSTGSDGAKNRAELVGGGVGWSGVTISAPGAGYSDALNKAAMKATIDSHAAHLTKVRSSFAFNPYQILKSQTEAGFSYTGDNQSFDANDGGGIPNTKEIADYFRLKLGLRAILENNSARDSYFTYGGLGGAADGISSGGAGALYDVYNYFLTLGPPYFFQTASSARIGDFNNTMDGIVNILKGNAVEPPVDYPVLAGEYLPANFGVWNGRLIANPTYVGGGGGGTSIIVNVGGVDDVHFRDYPLDPTVSPGLGRKREYALAGVGDSGVSLDIVNGGTHDTFPVTLLYGAMTNPVYRNETTGQEIVWTGLTLNDGDFLKIDHASGEVLLNGATLYEAGLDLVNTDFWPLVSGDNVISLIPFSAGPGAKAVIYWRNAF